MNIFFEHFHQALASGGINLLGDTIRAVLLSPAYIFSAEHKQLSDITFGFVNGATPVTAKNNPSLSGKGFIPSASTGQPTVFTADPITFSTLTANSEAMYIALYDQTAENAKKGSLICVMQFNETKVPDTQGNIYISWNTLGIFDIGEGEKSGGFEHSHINKIYLDYVDQPIAKNSAVEFASIKLIGGLTADSIGGLPNGNATLPLKLSSDLDQNGFSIAGIKKLADDTKVMHLEGDEELAGTKLFSGKLGVKTAPSTSYDVVNFDFFTKQANTYSGTTYSEFAIGWKDPFDANTIRLKLEAPKVLSLIDKDDALCSLDFLGVYGDTLALGTKNDGTFIGKIGLTARNGLLAAKKKHSFKYDITTDSWFIGDGDVWTQISDTDHTHLKSSITDFAESEYLHTRPDNPLLSEPVFGEKVFTQLRIKTEYPIWQPGVSYTKATTPKIWAYSKLNGVMLLYTLLTDHVSSGTEFDDDLANWEQCVDQGAARKVAFASGTGEKSFALACDSKVPSSMSADGKGNLIGKFLTKHDAMILGPLHRVPPEKQLTFLKPNTLVYDDGTNTLYRILEPGVTVLKTDSRENMNSTSISYDPNYTFYLYDKTKATPVLCARVFSATQRYYIGDYVFVPSTGYGSRSMLYMCFDDNNGAGIQGIALSDISKWKTVTVTEQIWKSSSTMTPAARSWVLIPESVDRQAYAFAYTGNTPLVIDNTTSLTWDDISSKFQVDPAPILQWKQGTAYAAGTYVTFMQEVSNVYQYGSICVYYIPTAYTSSTSANGDVDAFRTDITAGKITVLRSIDTILTQATEKTLSAQVTINAGDVYAHAQFGVKYANAYAVAKTPTVQTNTLFDDDEASKWIISRNPHLQHIVIDSLTHIVILDCALDMGVVLDEDVYEGMSVNVKTIKGKTDVMPSGVKTTIDGVYTNAAALRIERYGNITLLCAGKQFYAI